MAVDEEIEAVKLHAVHHFGGLRFGGAFVGDGRTGIAMHGAKMDGGTVEIQVFALGVELSESEGEGNHAVDECHTVGCINGDGSLQKLWRV